MAWFRDSKLLESSDNIEIIRMRDIHALTLYNTVEEDTAKYSCTAINPAGEKWHEFALKVKGKVTEILFYPVKNVSLYSR